jgi:acyl-coenzyme A thioesterase PaaI-like protein
MLKILGAVKRGEEEERFLAALGMTAGGVMMAAANEEFGAAMRIHKSAYHGCCRMSIGY